MSVSLEDPVLHRAVASPPGLAQGLRVLAFCDYFHPAMSGGAERVAFEVYRRLSDWGAEVTVVTAGGQAEWWDPGLRVVRARSSDLTARLGFQAAVTLGATRLATRLAAGLRPHVLHANSLQFQTSMSAARLQRRSGLPMVLTAHIGGFDALQQPLRAAAMLHERTVGRYLLGRSARVIAVSDAVAHHLDRLGASGRVRVVPNGVDHRRFQPRTPSRPSDDVHVLFVGRLVPNKGPAVILEAFARLHGWRGRVHLTIAGDGPMRAELVRRARALGLEHVVRFAGFTDRVEDLLADADVFVRPTLTEGMPLAVLEAMAAGVCVVASDIPGNAGLVEDGGTGLLFRPGDVAGLAEALRRLVSDPHERDRLAGAGRAVAARYSWDRCAEETLEVLLEVAPIGADEAAV